jgi:hypothetical protein
MHAVTSIVHGIFILLLRKVLLAQGGRHGMLLLLPQTEDSFTARRFDYFVMMVLVACIDIDT